MPKDMSYRKPAPIYVPTPPPSPPSSLPITEARFSLFYPLGSDISVENSTQHRMSYTVASRGSFSSRPEYGSSYTSRGRTSMDITEVGETVYPMMQARDTRSVINVIQFPASQEVQEIHQIEQMSWPVPPPRALSPSPPPTGRQKRKTHQYYRPPTPPLPSEHKASVLRRETSTTLSSSQFESSDGDSFYYSATFDVVPMTAKSFASLRTNPSYRTEKTQSSYALSNPSTVWSMGQATFVNGAHSEVTLHELEVLPPPGQHGPILPLAVARRASYVVKESSTESAKSWWGCVGSWGSAITTKLRSFGMVFC